MLLSRLSFIQNPGYLLALRKNPVSGKIVNLHMNQQSNMTLLNVVLNACLF